jgi:perosamine synthetase
MGALYDELLGEIRGLKLQARRDWARVNYWMYAVTLEDEVGFDAAALADRLRARGVETRPFFLGMHEQPVFHRMGLFQGVKLPVTEKLYRRGLYLPSGLTLTEDQVATVARAVRESLQ